MASLHAAVVFCVLAATGDAVLLDFHADWCAPCRQMDPIVRQLEAQGYAIRRVNGDREPQMCAQYNVVAYPTFILSVDGRETGRLEGVVTAAQLVALFDAARLASSSIDAVRGQSPDDAGGMRIRFPSTQASAPLSGQSAGAPSASTAPALSGWSSPPNGNAWPSPSGSSTSVAPSSAVAPSNNSAAWGATAPAAGTTDPMARLMAASVRIRVDDGSVGSGTIIDARDGEALVLTCGHLFRDSHGQGRITVDLFGPGAPQKLPAELISYNIESDRSEQPRGDVALISFRPPVPVSFAPVAPRSYQPQKSETVVSIGCDHGQPPTQRVTQITSINKFLGAPNIQIAGQPVQGRSGGGLFTADGRVIGVCNCADPSDNEGLFAAVETIHRELDRAGLSELLAQAPQGAAGSLAAAPPQIPAQMPGSAASGSEWPSAATQVAPISPSVAATAIMSADALATLTPQERATLEDMRQRAAGAEVICIVRPLGDPRAKSEVFVLDKASPDFLDQLYADRVVQDSRFVTTAKDGEPRLGVSGQELGNAAPAVRYSPTPAQTVSMPRASNWQPRWVTPASRSDALP